MNDSRRQTKLARLCKFSLALGVATLLFPATGCVGGDAFRSVKATDSDTQTMLAESQAIQSDTPPAPTVVTTLVSAAIPAAPIGPSLITLASHADLNQKIAEAPGPVLLDFYADWCGPCRKQGKILHEMEGAAARAQTTIIKINIDDHRDLAKQLNVSSLPTLMMVKNGQVTERQTGVATKTRLASWMQ